MSICADCIQEYFAGSFSYSRGRWMCDYCNQYRDIYDLRSGSTVVKKKRLPLKREDRLRRMFIVAAADFGFDWGDGGPLEGTIELVIQRLKDFAKHAENAGYTNIYFREESEQDEGTWYVPYGVRAETNKEMKKRFGKIRRRREHRKKKREAANVKE